MSDLNKEIQIKLTIDGNDANTTLKLSNELYEKIILSASSYNDTTSGVGSTTKSFTSDTSAMNQVLNQFGSVLNQSDVLLKSFQGGIDLIANNLPNLVQGFKFAGKEASSMGTTIGAQLITSLAGGGGLTLALNAVSFLLKILPSLFSDSNDEIKKQKDEVKKLRDEYAKLTEQEIKNYLHELAKQKVEIEKKHPEVIRSEAGYGSGMTGFTTSYTINGKERFGKDYESYQDIEKRMTALKATQKDLGIIENINIRIRLNQEQLNKLNENKDSQFFYKNIIKTAGSYIEANETINQWIEADNKILNNLSNRNKSASKNNFTIDQTISNKRQSNSDKINIKDTFGDINAAGLGNLDLNSQIIQYNKLQETRVKNELLYADISAKCANELTRLRKEEIEDAINYTSRIFNTLENVYTKYYSSLENKTRKELNEWQNNEKRKLDEERKAALSHARTTKQKEKIAEEYDKKEQALEDEKQKKAKERLLAWFNVQKAVNIAQATIATYKAADEALGTPPWGPWNLALAAAVIATGLANVAVISTQKVPGYAKGGAIVGENGPEIIAPFQDYASGQSKLINMTMLTLKDEIRSGRTERYILPGNNELLILKSAIDRLNNKLDEGIDARAYLDDKQAKRISIRASAINRKSKF